MATITTIGIVTADRPAIVRRALGSLVRNCDTHEERPRLVVIDGSRRPANRAATAAAAAALATGSGYRIEYVGTTEAAHLLDHLAPGAATRRLLLPGSTGANRNLLLLLTSGEHVLAVDDDVVCETWTRPGSEDGLSLMGHRQEFLETAFWPSRAAALAAVARTPVNLLGAHGALLGHSLAALIAAERHPVDLTRGCGHLRSALVEGRSLIVKATFAGLAGDAGTYCPYRLLFSAGPLRDRLWSDRAAFATALTSREVSRGVTTNVVTHDCSCMATCMGLANNALVPPFMPAGRNEDGVFGVMLASCDQSAVFGHVPVGIIHDSGRPSKRAGTRMLSAIESRLAELVVSFVRRLSPPGVPNEPAVAMQRVGRAMMNVGEMNSRTLEELVRDLALERRRRELARAGRMTDDPQCPDYWRAALGEYRDLLLVNVARREFFLPIEFHGSGSVDDGYRALQEFFRDFGLLVATWPELWQMARALNANHRVA